MATDPNIILQAGQINDPARLAQSQMLQLQLQQQQQAMRGQNALKQVFAQPGALQPNGTVSPNALAAVMRIDPQTGLDLAKQNRAAMLDQLHIKAAELGNQMSQTEIGKAKWSWMTDIAAETADAYDAAVKGGASPEMALAKATQTRDEMIRANGGQMSEQDEQAALARPLNIDEARAMAAQNAGYVSKLEKDREFGLQERTANRSDQELTETIRHDKAEESKPVNIGTSGLIATPDGKGGYKVQDALDFGGGGWTSALPKETQDYVGKVLGGGTPNDARAVYARMLEAEGGTDAQGNFRTSPKGAVGPAQLMPATMPEAAQAAGMRFDAAKARTDADYNRRLGFAYFQKLVSRYNGDMAKAVAAYNAGPGAVDKALSSGGGISRSQARESVAEMVAHNDIKATTAISRLPAAEREWVIARAHQINPNFDETTFNMKNKYAQGLGSSSPGTSGGQIRSLNVAVSHLNTLGILSMALKNGNVQAFNTIKQFFGREFGSAAPTNFNAVKGIVARELVKAVAGMGGGVSEQQDIAKEMNNINSPDQLMGFIDNQKQLMIGQLEGQRRQYEQVTGKNDFDRWLSDDTKREMGGIASNPSGGWGKLTVVGQ
jgi:hypothetical protein